MTRANKWAILRFFFETKVLAIFRVLCQRKIDIAEVRSVVYDKYNSSIMCDYCDFGRSACLCLDQIVGVANDRTIIYKIDADEIVQRNEKLRNLPLTNPTVLDQVEAMDNVILAFAIPK